MGQCLGYVCTSAGRKHGVRADESFTVSKDTMEAALDTIQAAGLQQGEVEVIDAFEMPVVQWDTARKRFYLPPTKPSLYPAAAGKAKYMAARLQMIEQRVLRSSLFQETALCSFTGHTSAKA